VTSVKSGVSGQPIIAGGNAKKHITL